MMKRQIFIVIGVLALFAGCKKELVIDIQETRCKNFKISNASNDFTQPNCPGDIASNTFNITFNYDGDDECLKTIHRMVTFYDDNNNVITPFTQDPEVVSVDESSVTVGGGFASFKFDFTMASVADYNNIAYATIDFRTKNSNLDESNFLSVLEPICGAIPVSSTVGDEIFVRKTQDICVSLRDDAAEDGDIITIILNGVVIADNVTILNTPKTFKFDIDPNIQNFITFYAVNEGSSSPNTVVGTVEDGINVPQSFDRNLDQGETVSFKITFQAL